MLGNCGRTSAVSRFASSSRRSYSLIHVSRGSRMAVAQHIVGTSLGRAAMRARDAIELHTADAETVGCVANDHLAAFLVTRLCRRHFVDVSAHIGSIIAEVDPSIRITAIEPIPEKAERLRKKFPTVELHQCALSDHEGHAPFFVNPRASGYSSLDSGAGTVEINVPVKRLDALVSEPDVVKIDVEGAELGVLRGCEKLETRPVYMFESGPQEVLGYTKADL